MDIIGKLEVADYWEWRTTVTELEKSAIELKYKECLLAMMEKDIEICRLRSALFKHEVQASRDQNTNIKNSYESFKQQLEKKIGFSLNNCVIDDTNFEVKKL